MTVDTSDSVDMTVGTSDSVDMTVGTSDDSFSLSGDAAPLQNVPHNDYHRANTPYLARGRHAAVRRAVGRGGRLGVLARGAPVVLHQLRELLERDLA